MSSIFKGIFNEEKKKGLDGKACWKGYRYAGTQKKGGKTVDKCVKVNENVDEYDINEISAKVNQLGIAHGKKNQMLKNAEQSFQNKWPDLDPESIAYLVEIYTTAISNQHKNASNDDHEAWQEKRSAKLAGRDYHEINESRPTNIIGLIGSKGIGSLPMVEKIVDIRSQADGMSALVRTVDGNAYEVTIRPAEYSKHPDIKQKTLPSSEQNESSIMKGLQS